MSGITSLGPINNLSPEVLFYVLEPLEGKDRSAAHCVSRCFYRLQASLVKHDLRLQVEEKLTALQSDLLALQETIKQAKVTDEDFAEKRKALSETLMALIAGVPHAKAFTHPSEVYLFGMQIRESIVERLVELGFSEDEVRLLGMNNTSKVGFIVRLGALHFYYTQDDNEFFRQPMAMPPRVISLLALGAISKSVALTQQIPSDYALLPSNYYKKQNCINILNFLFEKDCVPKAVEVTHYFADLECNEPGLVDKFIKGLNKMYKERRYAEVLACTEQLCTNSIFNTTSCPNELVAFCKVQVEEAERFRIAKERIENFSEGT